MYRSGKYRRFKDTARQVFGFCGKTHIPCFGYAHDIIRFSLGAFYAVFPYVDRFLKRYGDYESFYDGSVAFGFEDRTHGVFLV